MHPVTARGIVTQRIGDLHAQAAAERTARTASRPRRPWLAVRRPKAVRAPRPTAVRAPQPTAVRAPQPAPARSPQPTG
jgi:hypothetical protein